MDPHGTVIAAPLLPTRPRATLDSRRDMIAAMNCVERFKRWMEEELQALDDMASDLGLEEDPPSVHIGKHLRTVAKWMPYPDGG
jgi:hypothetical protein